MPNAASKIDIDADLRDPLPHHYFLRSTKRSQIAAHVRENSQTATLRTDANYKYSPTSCDHNERGPHRPLNPSHTNLQEASIVGIACLSRIHPTTSSLPPHTTILSPNGTALSNSTKEQCENNTTRNCNAVMAATTGDLLHYRQLIKGPDAAIWRRSCANDFGRLAQGVWVVECLREQTQYFSFPNQKYRQTVKYHM